MRLYNPTPEPILGEFEGRLYPILSGSYIDVSNETASWIMSRWAVYGLVVLPDLKASADIVKEIAIKRIEGLQAHIKRLQYVAEQFMHLDEEIKAQNQYGTVLQKGSFRNTLQKIDDARKIVESIQIKYGIDLHQDDLNKKTQELEAQADEIVKQFQADAEAQEKAAEEDRQLNDILKQIDPGIR